MMILLMFDKRILVSIALFRTQSPHKHRGSLKKYKIKNSSPSDNINQQVI
jgi:hypothetical protein